MYPPKPWSHTNALVRFLTVLLLLLSVAQSGLAGATAQGPPARGADFSKPGGYLTGPAAGDPLDIALAYIRGHKADLGLIDDDMADILVKDRYVSPHNGVTHLYLRQRLDGIEVFNGDINVNVARDGRILNLGNWFVGSLRAAVTTRTPKLNQIDAVKSAAKYLGLTLTENLKQLNTPSGKSKKVKISRGGISKDEIPVELLYLPLDSGEIRLVWDMSLRLKDGKRWLSLRADVETGTVLDQVNWISDASGYHGVEYVTDAQYSRSLSVASIAQGVTTPPSQVNDGSSYLVYPLPYESPAFTPGQQQISVANPADALASPFGWHDTNGAAGPEYTITRGNNVHAYQDSQNIDHSSGDEPSGGAGLDFQLPVDLTQDPPTYQQASTVNLFYWNNVIHDIFYHYGFTEAAGNFQTNNYGRGGVGGDEVQAEAQDGGGRNNANFETPPDGQVPRMQMYLGLTGLIVVNSPAGLGTLSAGTASFGPEPTLSGLTGDVVLAQDPADAAGPSATDGCSPLTNAAAVNGRIALIDRGTCLFVTKAKNAQNAGAIGVIIANNRSGAAPGLGGSDPTITIVSMSVTQSDGNALKSALTQGVVNVTLKRDLFRDGSLDNGVIAHEYGHGISNRLTGGPSNVNCLNNLEQAGEGWSDFFALVLTARPGDKGTDARGIGTWLFGQSPDGPGIRQFPYSTNLQINPHVYDDIKLTGGEPHAVGEIWTAMVWDLYWNLVDKYGFNSNIYTGTSGNNRALQLVVDGLTLQPCSPSFVQSRNAILAADVADYGGANQCLIWSTFARRGLGFSARAGSSKKIDDGTQAFDLPQSCR